MLLPTHQKSFVNVLLCIVSGYWCKTPCKVPVSFLYNVIKFKSICRKTWCETGVQKDIMYLVLKKFIKILCFYLHQLLIARICAFVVDIKNLDTVLVYLMEFIRLQKVLMCLVSNKQYLEHFHFRFPISFPNYVFLKYKNILPQIDHGTGVHLQID